MNPKQVISLIAEANGWSMAELARQVGMTEKKLYHLLDRNDGRDMKLSTFVTILNECMVDLVYSSEISDIDEQIVDLDDDF